MADTASIANTNGAGAESSKKQQMTEIAMNLLAQGRRHLLVADIPSAIAALAESTQILAEQYGEQADECAESYYYYGMALLEMARTDSDVLGDAVEGGDKGEEGDSSGDEEEEEAEDGEENQEDEQKKQVNGKAEETNGGEAASSVKESEGTSTSEDVEMKSEDASPSEEKPEKAKPAQNGTEEHTDMAPSDSKPDPKPTEKTDEAVSEEKASKATENGENKIAEESAPENKSEAKEAQNGDSKSVEDAGSSDDKTSEKPVESAVEKNGEESAAKPSKLKNEAKGKSLKAAGSSSAAAAEAPAEDVAEEDTGDEVSNLQLAWEVFELAKNIFQRKAETDPSVKPRLADALVRLAEVAIESENYTSAIEDLQKCLEIQKASFPDDSRSMAETYYQLGVAYTFTTEFREAVKCFESAADVIKLRIENLKNPTERKPSMEEPRNMFHTIEGEIEELESLLPDIREKIADTIDLEKEAARKVAEQNGASTNGAGTSNGTTAEGSSSVNGGASASGSPDDNKPALDITHLIRKKRKPEEAAAEAETASAAKKVCAEPGVDVASS